MSDLLAPENAIFVQQKSPGHDPWIALWLADEVPLQQGSHRAEPDPGSEEGGEATAFPTESIVENALRIGDGGGRRPVSEKECVPVADLIQVDEDDRRIDIVCLRDPAEILDRFAAEWSAEVAEEDEQGGLVGDQLAKGLAGKITPGERGVQDAGFDELPRVGSLVCVHCIPRFAAMATRHDALRAGPGPGCAKYPAST
ncbi:MAG: hypothetical protein KDB53_00725 [Planctomycetes bacterium]|nr:hypothetical protein [Planctomycetota bacterium]